MKIIRIAIILPLLCYAVTSAGQIRVCGDCKVRTVSEGIALAQDGDTVFIDAGTYVEHSIKVDKQLVLIGRQWPVIDAGGEAEAITVIADSVTIQGIEIRNIGTSYLEDRAGIRVRRAKEFKIINNRLYNTFFGIYLEHCSRGVVADNSIIGEAVDEMSSGNAIHLWYCKHVEVKNNTVSHHRDGIYFEFVDSSTIYHNTSEDNLRYGLHFMFSNYDEYFENVFQRNGAGVAVMFSRYITMTRNIFRENWGKSSYGLLLKEIYDGEITFNTFDRNSIGIYVEGSNRINYKSNDFLNNGWAIKISGGCLDNVIERNNFVHNTFDLSLNTSSEGQVVNGNYWSSYSGYDLNRDGTGDVPYRPVKLFNYVINRTPEAIVLLRSLFIDLINFSERVSPVLTPVNLVDASPKMRRIEFQ